MPYELAIADSVRERLRKMVKRDSTAYRRLLKIFDELKENPNALGKWMHNEYAMVRERHVGHFVLKYTINEKERVVTIVDYGHHE